MNDVFNRRDVLSSCESSGACLAGLENLAVLTNQSFDIVERMVLEEAQELRDAAIEMEVQRGTSLGNSLVENWNEIGEVQRRQSLYEAFEGVFDNFFRIQACQIITSNLEADSFNLCGANSDFFYVSHNTHNNYLLATGCTSINGDPSDCTLPRRSAHQDRITAALAIGADPYLAITIGLMEGGNNGLENLYLDPVGQAEVLGCVGEPITQDEYNTTRNRYFELQANEKNETPEERSERLELSRHVSQLLNSYRTYYRISPSSEPINARLGRQLQSYYDVAGDEPLDTSSQSTICFDTSGGSLYLAEDTYLTPEQTNNHCCRELPFKINSPEDIEDVLTLNKVRTDITRGEFRNERSIEYGSADQVAHRIQRFNGHSPFMGRAERTDLWRAGVNHFRDPQYGYQAMDYMVRTVMTNPVFQEMVEESRRELESSMGSLPSYLSPICLDHRPEDHNGGDFVFVIDSDHYHELSARSVRFQKFKEIEEELQASNPDYTLTLNDLENHPTVRESEIGVLSYEFREVINTYQRLGRGSELPELDYSNMGPFFDFYWQNVYPERDTIREASQQSGYSWDSLSTDQARQLGSRLRQACSNPTSGKGESCNNPFGCN